MTIKANDLGLLILRIVLGTVFIAHGAQKLFGWFGGDGLSAEADSMAERGLEPAMLMAVAAGLVEFSGGLLVLLGLLTPLGALALAIIMVGATATDTGQNGFFIQNDGFEYNLVLFTICVAFLLVGAGALSLDRVLSSRSPHLQTLLRQAHRSTHHVDLISRN
jgi:putative oxidoreductase